MLAFLAVAFEQEACCRSNTSFAQYRINKQGVLYQERSERKKMKSTIENYSLIVGYYHPLLMKYQAYKAKQRQCWFRLMLCAHTLQCIGGLACSHDVTVLAR